MKHLFRSGKALCLAGLLLGTVRMGFGYGTTYVSRLGADSASCGINLAPCYSLQSAYANTDPGGTIKIMDANAVAPSGIVINRPVTIDGSGLGVIENIFSPKSPAILVSANCTLRNLVIQVTSGDGIQINTPNLQVNIENVQIQGAPASLANGIHLTAAGVNLSVYNSTIESASIGINLAGANAVFTGSNLQIHGSLTAGIAISAGSGSLRHSLLQGAGEASGSIGLSVLNATFTMDNCESTANAIGVSADGSPGVTVVRIGNSVIAGNATGLSATKDGQILSLRTNTIAGNVSDGTPPVSLSLK